jgi:hypothetical protein
MIAHRRTVLSGHSMLDSLLLKQPIGRAFLVALDIESEPRLNKLVLLMHNHIPDAQQPLMPVQNVLSFARLPKIVASHFMTSEIPFPPPFHIRAFGMFSTNMGTTDG